MQTKNLIKNKLVSANRKTEPLGLNRYSTEQNEHWMQLYEAKSNTIHLTCNNLPRKSFLHRSCLIQIYRMFYHISGCSLKNNCLNGATITTNLIDNKSSDKKKEHLQLLSLPLATKKPI